MDSIFCRLHWSESFQNYGSSLIEAIGSSTDPDFQAKYVAEKVNDACWRDLGKDHQKIWFLFNRNNGFTLLFLIKVIAAMSLFLTDAVQEEKEDDAYASVKKSNVDNSI